MRIFLVFYFVPQRGVRPQNTNQKMQPCTNSSWGDIQTNTHVYIDTCDVPTDLHTYLQYVNKCKVHRVNTGGQHDSSKSRTYRWLVAKVNFQNSYYPRRHSMHLCIRTAHVTQSVLDHMLTTWTLDLFTSFILLTLDQKVGKLHVLCLC